VGCSGELNPETAARAQRTTQPNFTLHGIRQFTAQHQSNARAWNIRVFAPKSLERLEQQTLLFLA